MRLKHDPNSERLNTQLPSRISISLLVLYTVPFEPCLLCSLIRLSKHVSSSTPNTYAPSRRPFNRPETADQGQLRGGTE